MADQAAALAAAGCRVAVASFDPAELFGTGGFRERLAAEVTAMADRATAAVPFTFASSGREAPAVPVARLPVPGGRTPSLPIVHAAHHRTVALRRLGARAWGSAGPAVNVPRPTIVHAHTGYPDGVAAAALAADLDVPLVITEHATFLDRQLAIPEVRAAYVAAGRQAVRVLAVSAVFADHLRVVLPELADRVDVVPNAVDVGAFTVADADERRPEELLFVGYLKEIKGIDVLLRSLARVRAVRPGATLRLIGDAADPTLDVRWRALADELDIRDAVTFDPPLDRAGVAAAMRRADVFVHASRYETFGVVAAEALAAGLPVVATESRGVPELLGDAPDALGAIVPKDDPDAFAAAVLRVLDRRADYDGHAIRASIVARVGGPAVAARLIAIYDEALTSQQEPGATILEVAQPSSAPESFGGPLIVVAFDPQRARLLERLEPAERARMILVTSSGPAAAAPDGFGAVVTANLHDRVRAIADTRLLGPRATGWRRLAAAARHPLATARRRGLLPGLEAAIRASGTPAIRRAVDLAREAPSGVAPAIVAADGIDALAARAVLDEGVAVAAPGGLRWAADQATSGGGWAP